MRDNAAHPQDGSVCMMDRQALSAEQLEERGQTSPDTAASGESARRLPLVVLCLLALAVGIITGIGAVAFRALIGLVHNLLFIGHWSFAYDSSVFTPPSPWGPLVILVPVLGAIGVTFIV